MHPPVHTHDMSTLQSLDPHLLDRVVQVDVDPSPWLMSLPQPLHKQVLQAAVRGSSLQMKACPGNSTLQLAPLLSYRPELHLERLSLGCADKRLRFDTEQQSENLACLSSLKALELFNVHLVVVSSSLRGLTHLKIDASALETVPNAVHRFTAETDSSAVNRSESSNQTDLSSDLFNLRTFTDASRT